MDDIVTLTMIALSGFFVVLSFVLLVRYRQVSQRISASSDLGHDLWQALELRLKKQDERVLDMMGKFEVIQSRVMERETHSRPVGAPLPPVEPLTSLKKGSDRNVSPKQPVSLDQTEKTFLKLIGERPRTSVEIKELVGKSREHTARLMKSLYERKLVTRDDSKKPFVYQLTDDGRSYLSVS